LTDDEVIEFEMVTKKGGTFRFLDENLRDFFVADYVTKCLKSSEISDDFLEMFVKILTIKKYEVIRMFINDVIDDSSVMHKIQDRMQEYIEYFYKMGTFDEYFIKFLENLVDFIIQTTKAGDHEKMKKIVSKEAINNVCETKDPKMFSKFHEFLTEFYNPDELKSILKSKNHWKRTMLHDSAYYSGQVEVFKNLWTIYKNSLSDKELIKVLGLNDGNILHIAGRLSMDEIFVFVLEELDKIPLRAEIRKVLRTLGDVKQNLLQSASYSLKYLETHKIIWKIYRKYFEPHEMLELINYINSHDNNLLYDIINNTNENAEFIWNQMKSFMTYEEQVKCLTTKRCGGQNLIERTYHNCNPNEIRRWVVSVLQKYHLEIPKNSHSRNMY